MKTTSISPFLALLLFILAASINSCTNNTKARADFSNRYVAFEPIHKEGALVKPDNAYHEEQNGESYQKLEENAFEVTLANPLSTFSVDVDNASYTNCRRFLNSGSLPPKDAVRIEEFINYFDYNYQQPTGDDPFSVYTELTVCPWDISHQLVMIGLQGKEVKSEHAGPNNLVFLVDVSGSMGSQDKLPLVQEGLIKMVNSLNENDRVAIVTYAGDAGELLSSTPCSKKSEIINAIEKLVSGGSTNGGGGIKKAYEIAEQNKIENGNNRVILCTDGDFNVGITDKDQLIKLIEEKRNTGIFLTTCGFGTGNYQEDTMEQLADKGNGVCYYIDSAKEASRVFVDGLNSTLYTIAKDVKIQVEFNPLYVQSYRLIGYENRALADDEFDNDAIDAGDIGAGHTVTALYEIVPAYGQISSQQIEDKDVAMSENAKTSGEVLSLKLRYKEPSALKSQLLSTTLHQNQLSKTMSDNMRWSSAVASFGLIVRESAFKGNSSIKGVKLLASGVHPEFMDDGKKEFLELVQKADGYMTAKN
jgi:Ca-activated chloride channel homolog